MVFPGYLIFIKAAVIALLVFLALVFLRPRFEQGRVVTALYALSIAGYQCATLGEFWTFPALRILFMFGAVASPFLFWIFSRVLFEDSFRFRFGHALLFLGVEALSFAKWFGWFEPIKELLPDLGAVLDGLFPQLVSLVFVALAIFAALRNRQSDLIETRRRLRTWLVVCIGLYGTIVLMTEVFLKARAEHASVLLETLNSLMILGLALFFGLRVLQPRTDLLWFTTAARTDQPRASATGPDDGGDPREIELVPRLSELMEGEGLFRAEGLSIRALADRLDTPEYRLRRVINRRLGYRNFNDYLNRYRVDEARRLLTDSERRLPVLRIAMDLGYGSLATFNRAFRRVTGTTPTEYRTAALAAGRQSPESAAEDG